MNQAILIDTFKMNIFRIKHTIFRNFIEIKYYSPFENSSI